jgi:hypothetical protein
MGADPDVFAEGMLDRWNEAVPTQSSAILLLAPRERTFTVQVRFPVDSEYYEGRDDAYWFEKGVVPPSYAARIESVISPAVVPYFSKDDWEGGVHAAVNAVSGIIESAPKSAPENETRPST